jgi:hypothetical protein
MFYGVIYQIALSITSLILSPISKLTLPLFLIIRETSKHTYFIKHLVYGKHINYEAWFSAVKEFLISANNSMFNALISTPIVLREYVIVLFLSQIAFLIIHGDLLDFSENALTVSPLSSNLEDVDLIIKSNFNSSSQDVVECDGCQNPNVYAGLTGSFESDYFISLFIIISAVTIVYG